MSYLETAEKLSGERIVRKVVVKKVSDEPVVRGEEPKVMESLELDFEIPVEHDELLQAMTELLNKGDKRYLTRKELREFEMLMERKGVIEEGGLLRKGGILDKAGLMEDGELIKVDPEENKKLSLAEHLWPAINKANEEKKARRREMEASKSGKETPRRVSASVNRQRVIKEVRAMQKAASKDSVGEGKRESALSQPPEAKRSVAAEVTKESVALPEDKGRVSETEKKKYAENKTRAKKDASNQEKDGGTRAREEGENDEQDQNTKMKLPQSAAKKTLPPQDGIMAPRSGGAEVPTPLNWVKKTNKSKKSSENKKNNKKYSDLLAKTRHMYLMSSDNDEEIDVHTNFQYLLYASESITERPGPDGTGSPAAAYPIFLKCLSRGTKDHRMLHLWEVPTTGLPIKDRIQRQFSIPMSFQHDLSYNGKHIEDATLLSSIGLKPGGKLQLGYLSEGELEEVRIVYKWLSFMLRFGKDIHPSIFSGMCKEFSAITLQGINECLLEKLANKLFVPWESDIKYANRTYFIQMNGLGLLLDFYETLLQESWRTMTLQMKLLETGCILVLATLGSSLLNQQKIIAADGHGFVLQSMLIAQIKKHCHVVDTSGSPGPISHNNFLLKDITDAAVKFFFNFKECQEIHMDICSKSSAVDQILAIAHSPSFSVEQAQDCICLMACCMHSPDTHKWLCRNPTLEGIVDCVKTHRERGLCTKDDLTLLHYYAQVTLTHLIISSANFMSRKVMDKLVIFMEDFLSTTDPISLQKLEKRSRPSNASWSAFFPYLKVLMSPIRYNGEPRPRMAGKDSVILSQLQELSFKTMLFVIQVMVSGDPHKARRQLLEEKIFTYALCLSSNVPRNLQTSARAFVRLLRSDSTKPVPIPKLSVMAQARLAAVHFGLKRVMDRSAEELKLEVSHQRPSRANRDGFNPLFCILSM